MSPVPEKYYLARSVINSILKGPLGFRKSVETMRVVVVIVAAVFVFLSAIQQSRSAVAESRNSCDFPAIYNFGDSNSDTGSASATFGRFPPPNGETFFGKPSGRNCDGRLIIDFIAEKLGSSYLSAYLDALGASFRHGANFASSAAMIQNADVKLLEAGYSPLSLGLQLTQFEQFKSRTAELIRQGNNGSLANPEDFSRALYTLDIGQNDLEAALLSTTEEDATASIPNLINQFSIAVELLYKLGARAFWIYNTGPIGCLPTFVIQFPPNPDNADKNGCIQSFNEVAREFNKQLKDRVSGLCDKFQDAAITYVDIYSAKYSLISNAKDYGFHDPFMYCCGKVGSFECWMTKIVNGTLVYPSGCSDPSKFVSWDGIHYTEAANKLLAKHILGGSFSDPQILMNEACYK